VVARAVLGRCAHPSSNPRFFRTQPSSAASDGPSASAFSSPTRRTPGALLCSTELRNQDTSRFWQLTLSPPRVSTSGRAMSSWWMDPALVRPDVPRSPVVSA
jgi:hypothetical protein